MLVLKRSEYLLKILGGIFLIIFFAILQTSFFPLLPYPFNYFNLILPIIFFITVILNYRDGLWFALCAGIIIDFFSFLNFGALTLSMLAAVVFINWLFSNFFTNRSFYSLIILGFLGNLIYIAGLLFLNFVFFILDTNTALAHFLTLSNFFRLLWQILFNVLLLTILFFGILYNFRYQMNTLYKWSVCLNKRPNCK